jgi:hypothetical protein
MEHLAILCDTLDGHIARLVMQNAICKSPEAGGRGAFHADHDHQAMEPRGVLCHNCNVALGNFQDNEEILIAAIEYIRKWNNALRL